MMKKLFFSLLIVSVSLFAEITKKDINTNSKKYTNYLKKSGKVSYKEFAEITSRYSIDEIHKYQKEKAKEYGIPLVVHQTIIDVENGKEYLYTMNCNNNILPYTGDVMKNYIRYVNCSNNVDMGYGQVNYLVWKNKLNITQQDLLDGKKNIDISMKILKSNYNGNWIKAIGHYHSYTPKFYNRYVKIAMYHLKRNIKDRMKDNEMVAMNDKVL